MKMQVAVPAAIVAPLLIGALALASPDGPDGLAWLAVEQGVAGGGGYLLAVASWQIEGSAGGDEYRLLLPAGPTLGGNGCCCVYLPCLVR